MSIYIAKYMNLKKSKRPIFWNGGSRVLEIEMRSNIPSIVELNIIRQKQHQIEDEILALFHASRSLQR